MGRFRRYAALLAPLALVLSACQAGPGAPADEEWPDRLVLGLVPSREADVLIENAEPLTEYLSQYLSDQAGRTITVEGFVPQDYTGLVAAMETGQAHIGAFGPFSLLQARDRAGAEIILQSVRFGSSTYHTQWFTNQPDKYCEDDPVENDDGMLGCNGTVEASEGPIGEDAIARIAPGTTVSFVEQSSASGYIFPALQLIEAGIDHETDIEPIFSGGHDNSVLAVYNGDAEVGVSFDDARGTIAEEFPDVGEKVVVFALSTEIPNDGWVVAGDLPDDLKEAITQALLDYADSEEGKEVLGSIYEIDDLVPADQEAFVVVENAARELGVTGD
ncbi:MAG: phosphate/phosphite/phosphonate ABC transporter substrate-binding protein [Candidatus Limnocylindria bacterium]